MNNNFYLYERMMLTLGFVWSEGDNVFIFDDNDSIPDITVKKAEEIYNIVYDN